ncbi:MAG TPA: hypothetical protein VK747_01430 [Blastocatellia bacterium]|nr:hypothetical protein [Blastocatellia bacterium]
MTNLINIERRLRIAGTLIVLGLLIELGSLLWSHPLAFILFIVAGGLLMAAGIIVYLYSLVSGDDSVARKNSEVRPLSEA